MVEFRGIKKNKPEVLNNQRYLKKINLILDEHIFLLKNCTSSSAQA